MDTNIFEGLRDTLLLMLLGPKDKMNLIFIGLDKPSVELNQIPFVITSFYLYCYTRSFGLS